MHEYKFAVGDMVTNGTLTGKVIDRTGTWYIIQRNNGNIAEIQEFALEKVPKFKVGQKVKITSGYYKNHHGIVDKYLPSGSVSITVDGMSDWIYAEEVLEKVVVENTKPVSCIPSSIEVIQKVEGNYISIPQKDYENLIKYFKGWACNSPQWKTAESVPNEIMNEIATRWVSSADGLKSSCGQYFDRK